MLWQVPQIPTFCPLASKIHNFKFVAFTRAASQPVCLVSKCKTEELQESSMVLTWSEATKPMELKPEECSVLICWVMTVGPIATITVRHVLFLSQIGLGQHLCTPFLRTTTSTPFTYRWFIGAVLNKVNPSNRSTWTGPASRVFKNITWYVFCTVPRKHGLLGWKSGSLKGSWFG